MAVDILLEIGGIVGETKDAVLAGNIDVEDWSWSMANSGTMHIAGGGGAGKVDVHDITINKFVDKATTDLILGCCAGTAYKNATLTNRKAGAGQQNYMVITMEDVMITGYSTHVASSSDGRLMETINLNFASVKVDYTPQEDDHTTGGDLTMTWNIQGNEE